MEANKYKKTEDRATLKGVTYEFLVALLVYLRLKNHPDVGEFHIATNVHGAGKFDDVVVNYKLNSLGSTSPWHSCYVQLKHKERASISVTQLTGLEKGKFSLTQYLPSYEEIQKNIAAAGGVGLFCADIDRSKFVFYTNAPPDEKLEKRKKLKLDQTSNEFHFEDLFRSQLEKELIFTLDPEEDKDIYDSVVGDTKSDYLKKVCVFSGQCDVLEISNLIKTELLKCFPNLRGEKDKLYSHYKSYFENWWQDLEVFLDEKSDILKEYESMKLLESYTLKNIFFSDTALEILSKYVARSSLLVIETKVESIKVTITKLQRTLDSKNMSATCITLNAFCESEDFVRNHCKSGNSNVLVLISETNPSDVKELLVKIGTIQKENENKKVIIVSSLNLAGLLKSENKPFKAIKDSSSFNELDDKSKEMVADCKVSFQGKKMSLKSLFTNNNDRLQHFLSENEVTELITGGLVSIGQNLPKLEMEYYIPRQLQMRNVLTPNILATSKLTVVFLVTGLSVDKFQLFVCNNVSRKYHLIESEIKFSLKHKLKEITKLYLLKKNDLWETEPNESPLFLIIKETKATSHYNQLCLTHSNVMWLQVEEGSQELVWKASKGDISDLRTSIYKKEKRIYPQSCVTSLNTKYDIIIGEAGMGKTTIMEQLRKEMKESHPKYWVVFVNLRQHSNDLGKEITVLDYLTKVALSNSSSDLEKRLFKIALEETGNVIVLCDGMDETCPQYEDEVCDLLHRIKDSKVKKLIISSRYSMQNTLEEKYMTLSKEIVEFSENDQKKLIKKKAPELPTETISKFIASTVGRIPLLTMLFASVMQKPENKTIFLSNEFSIFNLVKSFVDEKFDIYFSKNKTNQRKEEIKRSFVEDHCLAALRVFTNANDLLTLLPHESKELNPGLEVAGLIRSVKDGKPNFIHSTFAEYFIALWFTENMALSKSFLRNHLYETSFDGIRNMLDNILATDCKLHKAVLEQKMSEVKSVLMTGQVDVNSVDAGGRQAIHLAAALGFKTQVYRHRPNLIKILLENGANVNTTDRLFGWTPLEYSLETSSLDATDYLLSVKEPHTKYQHIASRIGLLHTASKHGFVRTVQLLIDSGAAVMDADNDGRTPLHQASSEPSVETVQLLISSGAEVKSVDNDRQTPLHAASRWGSVETVQLLLNSGAVVGCVDNAGSTPLHHASSEGRVENVLLLIDSGADVKCVTNDGWTPLHFASRAGSVDTVQLLIKLGLEVGCADNAGWTPLHIASRAGRVQTVQSLINSGAKVSCLANAGWTPLHFASSEGRVETVQLLLNSDAAVGCATNAGWTSLHLASREGRVETVQLLLHSGAVVGCADNVGSTPLHSASRWGSVEVVELLIESGAVVGCVDKDRQTPLHHASRAGRVDTIKSLINSGAVVGCVDNDRQTPLHHASCAGRVETVQLLIHSGAAVGCADNNGWTPMHFASQHGSDEVVRLLLSSGADVLSVDNDGNNCLHRASISGKVTVAGILISAGVPLEAVNKKGQTPLQLAVENKHVKVENLLKSAAARK